jgi:4-amino-4-deoxy-L-arabinose transferase-like glycosyltransferase
MGQTKTDTDAPVWLNGRVLFILVAIVTIWHLVVAAFAGPGMDESYYTLWSQYLSIGYLDHPPMVALVIAAGRALLGDNLLGIRLVPTIMIALTALAIWRIGVLLFSRFVAAVAVLLFNFLPIQGLAYLATPDAPCIFFCAATLWAVAEFVSSRRGYWWLVAGVFMGLALWSKYTAAFLAIGLALYLLSSRERIAWLRIWQVWAGGVVALLVFSPVIAWNASHDWIPFRFQGVRTVVGDLNWQDALTHELELLYGYLVTLGPVVCAFAFGTIIAFFFRQRRDGWSGLALPIWASLPGLAYFAFHSLHGAVQAHWPLPLTPALTLIGAWAIVALWNRGAWAGIGLAALNCLLGIAFAALLALQIFVQPIDLGPNDRANELRGWPQLFAEIEATAKANGAKTISVSRTYELTGELSTQALFKRSDIPVRAVDEPLRWLFLPPLPADVTAAPSIFVINKETPPEWLNGAKLVGTASRSDRIRPFVTYWLFLVDRFPTPPAS